MAEIHGSQNCKQYVRWRDCFTTNTIYQPPFSFIYKHCKHYKISALPTLKM